MIGTVTNGVVSGWRAVSFVLAERGRRCVQVGDRIHVEVRTPEDAEDAAELTEALVTRIGSLPGVRWVDPQLSACHVVAALEPGAELALAAVVEAVEQAEVDAGCTGRPFLHSKDGHPSDSAPLARTAAELVANALGLGVAVGTWLAGVPRLPLQLDVAAAVDAVQNAAPLRPVADRLLGSTRAELGLVALASVAHGLAQRPLGPIVDGTHRVLRWRELSARRGAWFAHHDELYAEPLRPDSPGRHWRPERPAPVPAGPVERYSSVAWVASLGALAVALPFPSGVERGLGVVSAGLPKAARLGRDAFASALAGILAGAGATVLRPGALRVLDRVDTIVVDPDVHHGDAVFRALQHARDLGLEVLAVGEHAAGRKVVRRAQREGHAVLALGLPDWPGLGLADVSVSLHPVGAGVDIVWPGPASDRIRLFAEAARAARRASGRCARIAFAGGVTGAAVALTTIVPIGPYRADVPVDLAALLAIGGAARWAQGLRSAAAPIEVPALELDAGA